MDYNKFKGEKYKETMNKICLPLLIFANIFFAILIPFLICVDFKWIICIKDKRIDFIFLLGSLIMFLLNIFIFLASRDVYKATFSLVKDFILIRQTENIREKLLIEKLPVNVDLSDYFKQREIDLVEADTNGNYDLLKSLYLKERSF